MHKPSLFVENTTPWEPEKHRIHCGLKKNAWSCNCDDSEASSKWARGRVVTCSLMLIDEGLEKYRRHELNPFSLSNSILNKTDMLPDS